MSRDSSLEKIVLTPKWKKMKKELQVVAMSPIKKFRTFNPRVT